MHTLKVLTVTGETFSLEGTFSEVKKIELDILESGSHVFVDVDGVYIQLGHIVAFEII